MQILLEITYENFFLYFKSVSNGRTTYGLLEVQQHSKKDSKISSMEIQRIGHVSTHLKFIKLWIEKIFFVFSFNLIIQKSIHLVIVVVVGAYQNQQRVALF